MQYIKSVPLPESLVRRYFALKKIGEKSTQPVKFKNEVQADHY